MPFEIQIDLRTNKLLITRPDVPDQYFKIQNTCFEAQSGDYFKSGKKSFWLVARLPDGKQFFLADAATMNEAETLRDNLRQRLNDVK